MDFLRKLSCRFQKFATFRLIQKARFGFPGFKRDLALQIQTASLKIDYNTTFSNFVNARLKITFL